MEHSLSGQDPTILSFLVFIRRGDLLVRCCHHVVSCIASAISSRSLLPIGVVVEEIGAGGLLRMITPMAPLQICSSFVSWRTLLTRNDPPVQLSNLGLTNLSQRLTTWTCVVEPTCP